MGVSTRAFYAWSKQPESTDKTREKEQLKLKISELFEGNKKVYGARRLSEASEKIGMKAGRYKVGRLMTQLGLEVRYPKKFKITTASNHNKMISPNILNRQFDVTKPNIVWTTDITYVWTLEGWMYVAIVIDLFSRKVLGWRVDDHMRRSLCIHALQMAFWSRKPDADQVSLFFKWLQDGIQTGNLKA